MLHMDPAMPIIIGISLVIVFVSLALQQLKQPSIVAYMIAGILLGPHLLGLITDADILNRIGAFGVIFLLFFIGMEISLPDLVKSWKVIVLGTMLQILISIGCMSVLGWWLEWPINRILLLGFVISLSSTAVVVKILSDYQEEKTAVGKHIIGILLVQDMAIVPMLLSINFFSGQVLDISEIVMQVIGIVLLTVLLIWLVIKKHISLPFANLIKHNHELQMFVALLLCLGMSYITGFFGLSSALGAFVAGLIVSSSKEIHWIKLNLESFRNLFVAVFFISIGMSVDLQFLVEKFWIVSLLALTILISKTCINTGILKLLGARNYKPLYAGAVLSQIGEFSFVLAAVGMQAQIISQYAYQATITVIFLSLLLSYLWISIIRKLLGYTS